MKLRKLTAIITILVLTCLMCSCKKAEPPIEIEAQTEAITSTVTEPEATTIATTEATTEAPAEPETKATTTPATQAQPEVFDIKATLGKGYWVSGGEQGITVYTYDGEKMWSDYYENHNGKYVKMEGPGYSSFCIPELYEYSFMMYGEGGVKTVYYFTDNPRVVSSKVDSYGHYDVWINYDSIPDVNTVVSDMSKY